MFDFQSLLGKPTEEEQRANEFAAGFSEGVGLANRLMEGLAAERLTKGDSFINGVLMALKEEI